MPDEAMLESPAWEGPAIVVVKARDFSRKTAMAEGRSGAVTIVANAFSGEIEGGWVPPHLLARLLGLPEGMLPPVTHRHRAGVIQRRIHTSLDEAEEVRHAATDLDGVHHD